MIPAEDIADPEKEKLRLEQEEAKLIGELEHSQKVLSNESFVSRAPEAVVNKEREKLADVESKLALVQKRLQELK